MRLISWIKRTDNQLVPFIISAHEETQEWINQHSFAAYKTRAVEQTLTLPSNNSSFPQSVSLDVESSIS